MRYDNTVFPGEVKAITCRDVQVSVMVKYGSNFKWPVPEDSIFYSFSDVLRKIEPVMDKS